jgi:hypothetical protein
MYRNVIWDSDFLYLDENTHKELKIRVNKFLLWLLNLKGGEFRKKSNRVLFTGLGRTTCIFYFSEILKKLLSAYLENTLYG